MTTPEPADRGPELTTPAAPEPQPAGTGPESTGRAEWSSPATVAEAPPLGGVPPQPPAVSAEPARARDPVPRPARRSPRPWLILAVAALFLVCCYGGAAVALFTWGRSLLSVVRDRTEHAVGLGEPVRDGTVEFRVNRVRCGITQVGDPIINQTAVGQFCAVELDVRNIGGRPVSLDDARQQAYGPRGQRYLPDPAASLLASADQPVFLTDIDPGDLVSGVIVYDIPAADRIVRLRLHGPGSASAKGALIRL